MSSIVVKKSSPLGGNVRISGSKNAALPILAASLLCDEEIALEEVPDLSDIKNMSNLLSHIGADVRQSENKISLK